MPSTPVVLFDLDGTLVDTETVAIDVTERYFARHGHQVSRADLSYLVGHTWASSMEYLITRYPIDRDAATAEREILDEYRQALTENLPGIPGSIEAVKALAGEFRLGVVSNSRREDIESTLEALGIRPLIECVVGYEDTSRGKPAPDPYQEAIRRLTVEPIRVIVFEDSAAGVESAHAAGLSVVGVGEHPEALKNRAPTRWKVTDLRKVDAKWVKKRLKENKP